MYGVKLRYLASAFLDADSITATPRIFSELLKIFESDRLLPVRAFEPSPEVGAVQRIGFQSQDHGLEIQLLGKRFNVLRVQISPDGKELGEFEAFCDEAAKKLSTLLAFFERKSHRLAAVKEGLLPEMPIAEMDRVAKILFNMSPFYAKHTPFEWDWRTVASSEREFAGLTEPIIAGTTLKRQSGTILSGAKADPQSFDRIRADFDISTLNTKITPRFEEAQLQGFFESAVNWHSQLSGEISGFIGLQGA